MVDSALYARTGDTLAPIDGAPSLPEPLPVPAQYTWNPSSVYESAPGGALLRVHCWTVDPERSECCPEFTAVDRLVDGAWIPTARVEGRAAVVLDSGAGSLLMDMSAGWRLVEPH